MISFSQLLIIVVLFALFFLIFKALTQKPKAAPPKKETPVAKKPPTTVSENIVVKPVINMSFTATSNTPSMDVFPIPDITKQPAYQAETIFLYWSLKGKAVGEVYPSYMKYKYGITDALEFHKSLIDNGFLEPASVADTLNSLTIPNLKDLLSKYQLKKTGKKSELIDRLIQFVPESDLNQIVNERQIYIPSSHGLDILESNKIFIQLHQNPDGNYNYDSYSYYARKSPNPLEYNDYIAQQTEDDEIEYRKTGKWGLLRNTYFSRYECYLGDNEDLATLYLLRTILMDICGVDSLGAIKSNISISDAYFFFAPGILKLIRKSDLYITDALIDEAYNTPLPVKFCTRNEFHTIINEILNNTLNEKYWINKLVNKANQFSQSLGDQRNLL